MPTLTEETAEAICGALFRTDFRFLGESGPSTWWLRGEPPQAVKVEVLRDIDTCRVNLAWHNISSPPRIVQTSLQLTVNCMLRRDKVEEQTAGVVEKILQVYADVLEARGYAGSKYLAKQMEIRS